MFAYDFEYDGLYLSDFGFTICNFGTASDVESVSAGGNITFNKISSNRGKQNLLVGTKYDECITASFTVCKTNCNSDEKDMIISTDEYRDLMRWLNRHEFHKFQIIDNSESYKDACYFNASFNIEKIYVADKLYGLTLKMETDKPFGYGEKRTTSVTCRSSKFPLFITDMSDDIGETYLTMDIVCYENGKMVITNSGIPNNTLIIDGCTENEVIHIDGDNLVITSSDSSHDIATHFNFEFIKIKNTFDNRKNTLIVELPCKIVASYTPIIKDIPL